MKKLKLSLGITLLLFWSTTAQITNTFPNDGNVGIGTLSPISKLSVLGQNAEFFSGTAENTMIVGRNTSEKFQFRTTDDHGYLDYIQDSDSNGPHVLYIRNLAQGSHSNNDIQLETSSGKLILKKDGNVGVGTISPSSIFEVKSSNNNSIRLNRGGTPAISFLPNDGDSHFHISHTLDNRLTISQGSNVGDGKLLTIVNNGSVGIGTTSPDSKLTVKGNIHAEEVKVDLSVPGPDYVFKEGYDLKSLEEVQNYIKTHGHLPNIPSAQEMEANGIQLGEMNMKLLEKIEELTLYIIKLEKENKKILEIEKRLDKIEQKK